MSLRDEAYGRAAATYGDFIGVALLAPDPDRGAPARWSSRPFRSARLLAAWLRDAQGDLRNSYLATFDKTSASWAQGAPSDEIAIGDAPSTWVGLRRILTGPEKARLASSTPLLIDRGGGGDYGRSWGLDWTHPVRILGADAAYVDLAPGRAADLADASVARLLGVVLTSLDPEPTWSTVPARSRSELLDWFARWTSAPASYIYVAIFDKGDAAWSDRSPIAEHRSTIGARVGADVALYDLVEALRGAGVFLRSIQGGAALEALTLSDRNDPPQGSVISVNLFDAINRGLYDAHVPVLHARDLTDDEQEYAYAWEGRRTVERVPEILRRVELARGRLEERLRRSHHVSGTWTLLRGDHPMRGYYERRPLFRRREAWRDRYVPPPPPPSVPAPYYYPPYYPPAIPDDIPGYGYGGAWDPSAGPGPGVSQSDFAASGAANVSAQVSGPWAEIHYGPAASGRGGGAGLRGLSRTGSYERR